MATIAASNTPGGVEATPVAYHTPYIQQYSADIQQELSPTFMLDIAYFGTHGNNMLGKLNEDEPLPNGIMSVKYRRSRRCFQLYLLRFRGVYRSYRSGVHQLQPAIAV